MVWRRLLLLLLIPLCIVCGCGNGGDGDGDGDGDDDGGGGGGVLTGSLFQNVSIFFFCRHRRRRWHEKEKEESVVEISSETSCLLESREKCMRHNTSHGSTSIKNGRNVIPHINTTPFRSIRVIILVAIPPVHGQHRDIFIWVIEGLIEWVNAWESEKLRLIGARQIWNCLELMYMRMITWWC